VRGRMSSKTAEKAGEGGMLGSRCVQEKKKTGKGIQKY